MNDLQKNKHQSLIERCVEDYSEAIDRLGKLVRVVAEKLELELKKEGIRAKVQGRVKSLGSLQTKLEKWSQDKNKIKKLKVKKGVFKTVGDLAAVRVMTYVESDREKVAGIVKKSFSSREGKNDFELEKKEKTLRINKDENNFYRATHMQICLTDEELKGDNKNLKNDHCELQITSMLAHVWNEIEHDIRYKYKDAEISKDEILAIESLGLLTKSGDNIIASLITANISQQALGQEIKTDEALKDFLDSHYGKIRLGTKPLDNSENLPTLLNALTDLSLNRPDKIIKEISPNDLQLAHKNCQEFKKYLEAQSGSNNMIEIDTCDTYFMVLLRKHLDQLLKREVHGGRRDMSLAKRFKSFKDSHSV